MLYPGSQNDKIRCDLITESLKSVEGEYEAVSYLWGDKRDMDKIICNKRTIRVTRSLYNALLHLRLSQETRTLWADAICIDQHDLEEKSIEVARMADIYSSVSRTIVYLGEESDASTIAVGFIEQLSLVANESQQLNNMLLDPAYRQRWTALGEFLNNPYWTRIWIAQEIAVASKVVLQVGRLSIELNLFINVIFKLVNLWINLIPNEIHITLPQLQLNAVWAVLEARRRYQSKSKPKLDELLVLFLSSKATEPEDKVYGVYSMCTEAWRNRLPLPIYGIPLSTVYVATVQAIIQHSSTLDILSALNCPFASLLPSWCPNFNGSSPACLPSMESNWRCTGSKNLDVTFLDDRTMRVKGVVLDRVGCVFPTSYLHLNHASAWVSEMKQALMAMTWSPYGDEEHRLLALLDTLTLESLSHVILKARKALEKFNCVDNEELEEDTTLYSTWFIRRLLEEGSRPWLDGQSRRKHRNYSSHRSVALTSQGYICLLHETAREGDKVVLLYGGRVPFCVRQAEFGDSREVWRFIGDCYVHGIMHRQMMQKVEAKLVKYFYII